MPTGNLQRNCWLTENLGQRLCIYDRLNNRMPWNYEADTSTFEHVVLFIIIVSMAVLIDHAKICGKYHLCHFSTSYFGHMHFWLAGRPVVLVFDIQETRFFPGLPQTCKQTLTEISGESSISVPGVKWSQFYYYITTSNAVQSGVGRLLNTISFMYIMLISENITLLPQCTPLHTCKIDWFVHQQIFYVL